MEEESKKEQKAGEKDQGSPGTLSIDAYDTADVFEGAEPWDPVETKLVVWSFIVAAIALAIFGTLVNIYLL
jgi:hypothetical protein